MRIDALLSENLTYQEIRIVNLVKQGKSTKEIADELSVLPKSVRNYLTNIYAKFGVNSKAQLIVKEFELQKKLKKIEETLV